MTCENLSGQRVDIIKPGLFLCPVYYPKNIILKKKSFACFGSRKPNGEMHPVICHHHQLREHVYFDMYQIRHTTIVPDFTRPIPHIKISLIRNIFEIYLS